MKHMVKLTPLPGMGDTYVNPDSVTFVSENHDKNTNTSRNTVVGLSSGDKVMCADAIAVVVAAVEAAEL